MATTGSLRPIIDASTTGGRSAFFHPFGLIPKESSLLEYYNSPEANVGGGEVTVRPRSASNATMDLIDMRKNMAHSITDLFTDFEIKDTADVICAITLLIQQRTDFVVTAAPFPCGVPAH